MRILSRDEENCVSGGADIMTIYNAVKYGAWTPAEIAQDLYTAPGAYMTMADATAAAGAITYGAAALAAGAGYEIGTVAYDHMDVQTQDAIGGTIDMAIHNIETAYAGFMGWVNFELGTGQN
jgi:tripartite-type tricarboxylate transporter receptor subunit TctC